MLCVHKVLSAIDQSIIILFQLKRNLIETIDI